MKLTVLGRHGPYPPPYGACSAYLLETQQGRVMIDCGSGGLSALMGVGGPASLAAVILSHWHGDHMSDLLPMQYAAVFENQAGRGTVPITLLAPDEPCDMLSGGVFDMQTLQAGITREFAGMQLDFLPVRHPAPCYALRARYQGKTFVYSGDTNTCDALAAFAGGADLFLCDGCLTEGEWSDGAAHLSAAKAARLAQMAGVKRLVITHIRPGCDEAALLQEVCNAWPDGDIVLAREGYQYLI